MKRLRNPAGFSLIELLLAVGILAGAVVGLLGAVGNSYVEQVRNEDRLKAVWLANNKIALLQAEIEANMEKGVYPENDEKAGNFDEPDDDYKWTYSVKKVEIPIDFSALGGGSQGADATASAAEAATASAEASAAQGLSQVSGLLQLVIKDASKALREVKVTVSWTDSESDEEHTVSLTTHMVNMKQL